MQKTQYHQHIYHNISRPKLLLHNGRNRININWRNIGRCNSLWEAHCDYLLSHQEATKGLRLLFFFLLSPLRFRGLLMDKISLYQSLDRIANPLYHAWLPWYVYKPHVSPLHEYTHVYLWYISCPIMERRYLLLHDAQFCPDNRATSI